MLALLGEQELLGAGEPRVAEEGGPWRAELLSSLPLTDSQNRMDQERASVAHSLLSSCCESHSKLALGWAVVSADLPKGHTSFPGQGSRRRFSMQDAGRLEVAAE